MSTGRAQPGNPGPAPLLDARPGGPAERFADRLRHGIQPRSSSWGCSRASRSWPRSRSDRAARDRRAAADGWPCAHRRERRQVPRLRPHAPPHGRLGGRLDRRRRAAASHPGRSDRAGIVFLRKWRIAAFAVFVLVVESATYRVTSLAVPRDRPHVQRLEDLPVDASYPSGHTAAAIAVYAGLVLLLTSRVHSRALRIAAWAGALLIAAFVALARMYRGMHHPLDVAGECSSASAHCSCCCSPAARPASRMRRGARGRQRSPRSRHAEPIA